MCAVRFTTKIFHPNVHWKVRLLRSPPLGHVQWLPCIQHRVLARQSAAKLPSLDLWPCCVRRARFAWTS